ncbi:MAG: LacI family DNA-binding transcriptional regulator [Paracoccus sp. (in: a-proteobacteria)]|uniref:LacI family DNA-binding transcriptional regulator n=1 Tax=Paracoccus sp. TaxID=267 RepID=UPI0026E032B4|nr:LacI family DNA-binding transcriptional regulator [Paracoccus sp. (in: a-proteobacteria)]MDO5630248.1 LacI family DNA-binding transcriptional regulator [Paracoccus sp. (in: a-proteobacteria)]
MAENDLDSVTADDVAAAAGVSRWTVARAFKKDAPISHKSREKVMRAARDLGYAPDLLAASLAGDRSNLVAIITNDFSNPHKLVLLERLTRILWLRGWGALLVHMTDGDDPSAALLAASQRRVDAAVLIGTQFDDRVLDTALGARRVKKLVVFARYSQNPNTLTIACDDVTAMRQIADHLLERGYRRPVFLAGPDTQSAKLHRKSSFTDYWQARTGHSVAWVHTDAYDLRAAMDRVSDLLAGGPRPDVLVCENDIIAIGAMDAIRYRLGLRVPQDIAVTGFDDIPLAASPAYDLTTLRQPITAMAEKLVEVLEGRQSDNILLPGRLVMRGSA